MHNITNYDKQLKFQREAHLLKNEGNPSLFSENKSNHLENAQNFLWNGMDNQIPTG